MLSRLIGMRVKDKPPPRNCPNRGQSAYHSSWAVKRREGVLQAAQADRGILPQSGVSALEFCAIGGPRRKRVQRPRPNGMARHAARPVREVAVLVTGAKFRSAYEIYAHVIVAEQRGLSDKELSTIV